MARVEGRSHGILSWVRWRGNVPVPGFWTSERESYRKRPGVSKAGLPKPKLNCGQRSNCTSNEKHSKILYLLNNIYRSAYMTTMRRRGQNKSWV